MQRRRFLQALTALPALKLCGCRRRQLGTGEPSCLVEPRAQGPGLVLDTAQWQTLEAACACLLPSDRDPGATEARVTSFIDAQLATAHISSFRAEIAAGLGLLDKLATRQHGRRFAELPAAAKDQVLQRVERGVPLGRRRNSRHFFLVLLTLALEGFLGHPVYGGNHQRAGWRFIGFEPRPPLPRCPYGSEAAASRRAPASSASANRSREPRHGAPIGAEQARRGAVDAIVVGSGAGGAPVALALARAGYRVVVLEKGPAYDQRDFVKDEIRNCRRDFFAPYAADEPHVLVDESGRAQRTTDGWIACCVGGGTVHMSAFTYRLHPEDLRLRSLLGEVAGCSLADWPISWDELLPYYERIEVELGVSGDARRNPFESYRRPLPLPPLPENALAKQVEQACEKLGLHAFPTARSILSRAWQGRARCQLSFFCGNYGCDVGAKSSALAALLPKAVATGRCQIRPLSMAHTVEVDQRGRARAVRYLDQQGNEHRLAAAVIVLACSPLETARLMLRSSSRAHPDGLANGSGLLGRNLMFTGFGAGQGEFSRTDPRLAGVDWRQPFINRSFQDLYLLDRGKSSARKGGTVSFLLPHANPIFTAERLAMEGPQPLWGKALKDALSHVYRQVRELEFEVFAETLPRPESRVTLDPKVKDRWGLAVARFERRPHPIDSEVKKLLVDRGLQVLEAMGGKEVKAVRQGLQFHSVLQAGSCRFGDDPKTSVLDRDCRAHEVQNLFVTDGSFMPTSGGVPNTLTVEANALRVADRIVALGKAQALFGKG